MMQTLWKRWTRSGYLPSWFYAVLGSAFVALAIAGFMRGEWAVGLFCIAMIGVTIAASRYMPVLARAAHESTQQYYNDDRRGEDQ